MKAVLAISGCAAGAALAIAIGLERLGGLVPCALCLVERWPYRAALAIAVAALLLPRRWAGIFVALTFVSVGAAGLAAAVHVGVEQGWWPSPLPQCEAPRFAAGSITQRLRAMPARPSRSCEDPTYLVTGIPLSLAQANLVFAAAYGAALVVGLRSRGARHV